ncbi:MAG: SlyX family protein [Planctomycetota bacterium]
MATDRVELESKIAMLERTVDALSGELAQQHKRMDAMQANLSVLVEQFKRLRSGDDQIEPHDSKPPHWGG